MALAPEEAARFIFSRKVREKLDRCEGLLPESQGQNLALTVLFMNLVLTVLFLNLVLTVLFVKMVLTVLFVNVALTVLPVPGVKDDHGFGAGRESEVHLFAEGTRAAPHHRDLCRDRCRSTRPVSN